MILNKLAWRDSFGYWEGMSRYWVNILRYWKDIFGYWVNMSRYRVTMSGYWTSITGFKDWSLHLNNLSYLAHSCFLLTSGEQTWLYLQLPEIILHLKPQQLLLLQVQLIRKIFDLIDQLRSFNLTESFLFLLKQSEIVLALFCLYLPLNHPLF